MFDLSQWLQGQHSQADMRESGAYAKITIAHIERFLAHDLLCLPGLHVLE